MDINLIQKYLLILRLAKQLMIDAGYSSENPFPKLEILFNTNEDHRKIALAIQQMWQQNLGIDGRVS